MAKPKVSVIVPVYNKEELLPICLGSLLGQSLDDIEMICVDDCSGDNSANIIEDYAAKDSRIVPIYHTENKGTYQSRKDGVMQSTGKYIMFLDADDWYESDACEIAYESIEIHKTDIVQFGIIAENMGGISDDDMSAYQRYLDSFFKGKITGENLLSAWWEERKFYFSIYNKIYKGDICRKAFSESVDAYGLCGEDLFEFMTIAYYSSSYFGISTHLYHYNKGIGVTAGDKISLSRFESWLTEKNMFDAVNVFFSDKGDKNKYEYLIKGIHDKYVSDCVTKWRDGLMPEVRSQGLEELIAAWGYEAVVNSLEAIHTNLINKQRNEAKRQLTQATKENNALSSQITCLTKDSFLLNEKLKQTDAETQQVKAELNKVNADFKRTRVEKEIISSKLQRAYDEKSEINNRLKQVYAEKSEINAKLKQTCAEKSEINAKLKQTYAEKSEINAKLKQTYAEKSEINAKLKQTYAEKSEINAKLKQTYAEKSEINAKLKQAYADKSERGITIKELNAAIAGQNAELKMLRSDAKEYGDTIEKLNRSIHAEKAENTRLRGGIGTRNAQIKELADKVAERAAAIEAQSTRIAELEQQLEEYRNSFSYKTGRALTYAPRKIAGLFRREKDKGRNE